MISMDILGDIMTEVAAQRSKRPFSHIGHPRWTPSERHAILTAEVGEVAQEITIALEPVKRPEIRDTQRENLRDELVQVAACAAAWIQYLDDQRRQEGP